MPSFSTRTSLALGLALYVLAAFFLATFFGIMPDRTQAVREGRGALCESLAIHCSVLIDRSEFKQLESTLAQIVERNDDVVSAGLRLADGKHLIEIGDHAASWPEMVGTYSTDTHVHVSIERDQRQWGWLELQFRPLAAAGDWAIPAHPLLPPLVFIGVVCFLGFRSLLGTVGHLERSSTELRIRAAFDMLPEGLLLVDDDGKIVVANATITRWVGRDAEELKGKPVADLGWTRDYTGTLNKIMPLTAEQQARPQDKSTIRLKNSQGVERILWVNCSPVLGKGGVHRGTLISLQEVTRLMRTMPPTQTRTTYKRRGAESGDPMWSI